MHGLTSEQSRARARSSYLAVDEMKKFAHCKHFPQLDGANADCSIPVCEESMKLTAFHTPDGLYYWDRLLISAKPSSAVQQSPYILKHSTTTSTTTKMVRSEGMCLA